MPKRKSKKKAPTAQSWCWYCDREFEDDKVLLQHQKAKHFRCPHCPRRLNTAGGLSVHIDQVHKLGVDKIDNALPGRDSFDVEIYGMEGIPAPDLAEWKKRKAAESGDGNDKGPKKPRINLGVIAEEDLARQLAAHKALMGGGPAVPFPDPAAGGQPGFLQPPPFAPPPGFPALPQLPLPPPGMPFPPPGLSLPPGLPALPGMPGFTGMPPPFSGPPGSAPFPPPALGMPMPPFGGQPAPGMGMPPPFPGHQGHQQPPHPPSQSASPSRPQQQQQQPPQPAQNLPLKPPGPKTLKPGQVMVYGDEEVSPEEYRSRQARYVDAAKANGETTSIGAEKGIKEEGRGTKRARADDFE